MAAMFSVMAGVYILVTKFMIAPLIDKRATELKDAVDAKLKELEAKFAAGKEVARLDGEVEKLNAEIIALKLAAAKRRR